MNKKYSFYEILAKTTDQYDAIDRSLEIFIEVKDGQNTDLIIGYFGRNPYFIRFPSQIQTNDDLENNRDKLGKVTIKKDGKDIKTFENFSLFLNDIKY